LVHIKLHLFPGVGHCLKVHLRWDISPKPGPTPPDAAAVAGPGTPEPGHDAASSSSTYAQYAAHYMRSASAAGGRTQQQDPTGGLLDTRSSSAPPTVVSPLAAAEAAVIREGGVEWRVLLGLQWVESHKFKGRITPKTIQNSTDSQVQLLAVAKLWLEQPGVRMALGEVRPHAAHLTGGLCRTSA
jgi:hypothetical protein